jgi:hypothetical protein
MEEDNRPKCVIGNSEGFACSTLTLSEKVTHTLEGRNRTVVFQGKVFEISMIQGDTIHVEERVSTFGSDMGATESNPTSK